jgi:DNA polymerase V
MATDKTFALVDCNNFYASCERVFDPTLAGRAVVVLSNNDGCIIARSEEAKALGIRMGQPLFECRDLIARHGVHVFSSNFGLYGDLSRRVMETLASFTPDMEVYSIDEAFLDLAGIPGDPAAYAGTIRRTVQQWVGIPVSIGIGPSKTLAKAAAKAAKKHPGGGGVRDVAGREEETLAGSGVEDVWGVGRRYAKLLRSHGILTALDLRNAPDAWVKKHMTVAGLRTVLELRGTSCLPLEDAEPPRKAILCSRSFGRKVYRIEELEEAAAAYAAPAAREGRGPPAAARRRRVYRKGPAYRKVGGMLSGIVQRGQVQLSLFHEGREGDREIGLMHTVDAVNRRWGRGTLAFAASGFARPWWMRQARRSGQFTTSWNDLPRATAC